MIITFESFIKPITVAVTGGIASGKSTVCKYLEDKGYSVYYSDVEAKKIANTNAELKKEIIKEFGEESYKDGIYNTKYIANIVFNDKRELEKLNKIFKIHLRQDWYDFVSRHNGKMIFYESALIFEHKVEKDYDYIICAYANMDTIRKRLKHRNNYTDDEIDNRLSKLMSQDYKIKNSDFIINTEEDWKAEVNDIVNKIKNPHF